MAQIEGEIVIERPVEEVFDFVADERNEPRFNPRMVHAELISEGPIGLGTRFRTELKTMGRTMPMLVEFTAYERPRRLGIGDALVDDGDRGRADIRVGPGGTRMRWSWDVRPRGGMKLMTPLVGRSAVARSGVSGAASSGCWRPNRKRGSARPPSTREPRRTCHREETR